MTRAIDEQPSSPNNNGKIENFIDLQQYVRNGYNLGNLDIESLTNISMNSHSAVMATLAGIKQEVIELDQKVDKVESDFQNELVYVGVEMNDMQHRINSADHKINALSAKMEDMETRHLKDVTNLQWDTAAKTIIMSGITNPDKDKQPTKSKDAKGKEYMKFPKEMMHETLELVRTEVLPIFDLDEEDAEKAFRIPRPAHAQGKNPPRISVRMKNEESANAIMLNLSKLKENGKIGWHREIKI